MTARAGFSLPEALIALTISSVLVMLVGAVFLAQNSFYSHVLVRSQVQENARAMTNMVATEIRSIGSGAIVVADSSRLVIRAPMATAIVCGGSGVYVMVHIPGGVGSITTAQVAGFGHLVSGAWTYYANTWTELLQSGGTPAQDCYNKGADTVGISSEFLRFGEVVADTDTPAVNLPGASLMIYRQIELKFDASQLISGDRALYRGLYNGTLTELATGLADDAHFEYWTGSAWSKAVSGGALNSITHIRLVAESAVAGETSTQQDGYEFGWTVDIPIGNVL